MNRTSGLWLSVVAVSVGALVAPAHAQDSPISTNMKGSWNNVKGLLERMAEKMPEENYSFKPSPEMQSFGQAAGARDFVQYARLRTSKGRAESRNPVAHFFQSGSLGRHEGGKPRVRLSFRFSDGR